MNDLDEDIDASGGGFEHRETAIVEHFYRARKTIQCAHSVFPVRQRSTGRWFPILMFFDQDNKSFSHAYRLEDEKQLANLITLLYGCWTECRRRNGGDAKPEYR